MLTGCYCHGTLIYISGIVFVIQDLADWIEADQCQLTIWTTDLYVVVDDILTVDITDIKQPVTIVNLPHTIEIPETIAGGSEIYPVGAQPMDREKPT